MGQNTDGRQRRVAMQSQKLLSRHDPWLQAAGQWLVQAGDPCEVNWAVLDCAALVCRARQPTCLECPVKARCKQGAGVISGRAGEA
jgi:adenine-specific DNA glycosylase